MAFNFGNLLMNIGRALPGFVTGEQAAIKDNWTDLKNYNEVKQGQMSNLFRVAAWPYALANVANQAKSNAINYEDLRNQYVTSLYRLAGDRAYAGAYSAAAPRIAGRQQEATLAALNKVYNKAGGLGKADLDDLRMGLNAQNGLGPDGKRLPGADDLWGTIFGSLNLPGLFHGDIYNPYLNDPYGGF